MLLRNIYPSNGSCILSRKPDNTANGMLVSQINPIKQAVMTASFFVETTKMEIAVVIELTVQ